MSTTDHFPGTQVPHVSVLPAVFLVQASRTSQYRRARALRACASTMPVRTRRPPTGSPTVGVCVTAPHIERSNHDDDDDDG
eukprot:1157261-Rhodomonas_salina.1